MWSSLVLVLFSISFLSASPSYRPLIPQLSSHHLVTISHITTSNDHFTTKSTQFPSQHPHTLNFQITSDTHVWSIHMLRDDHVIPHNFQHVIMTPNGEIQPMNQPIQHDCYYYGSDQNNNIITGNICNGYLHAMITHDNQIYIIDDAQQHYHDVGLKLNHKMSSSGRTHMMYRLSDIEQTGNTCGVGDGHNHMIQSHGVHSMSHDHHSHPLSTSHSHSHSHHEHTSSSTECSTAPQKLIELFYFNDYPRYQLWGDQTLNYAVALFQFQQRFYNQTQFACHITLRLSGMVTFAHGNPSGLAVRTCNTSDPELVNAIRSTDTTNWNKCCNLNADPSTTGCSTTHPVCLNMTGIAGQDPNAPGCWNKVEQTWVWSDGPSQQFVQSITLFSSDGHQIDADTLLNSFSTYVQSVKSLVETTFSPANVDHAQLLSGYNFMGPVLGIADIGGMCSTSSTGIIETLSPTAGYLASVAAHEMGHSLGSQHDGTGNNCPNNQYIMAPATSQAYATAFSACTTNYFNGYFASTYGDSFHPRCLENNQVGNDVAEVVSVCGDGIVSGSEQCDYGFSPTPDPCCNATTCQYSNKSSCPTVGPTSKTPATSSPGTTTSSPSSGNIIPGTTKVPGTTTAPGTTAAPGTTTSPGSTATPTSHPPTMTPTVPSAGAGGGAANQTASTAFLDEEMGGIKMLYLLIIAGVLVVTILAVLGYCCGCCNLQHGGKQYAAPPPKRDSHPQVQLANQKHHYHHHVSSPSHHQVSVRSSIKGPDSGAGILLQHPGVYVQQQDARGSFNVSLSPSPSPYGADPPPYHQVPPTPEGYQLNGQFQPQPSPIMQGQREGY